MAVAIQFIFDEGKACDAIVFLASLGLPGLSKYKLCKLVVLADKHHLGPVTKQVVQVRSSLA